MSYSFIQFLIEARSHAEINPKVSINSQIAAALNAAKESKSKIGGVFNCFVSFTEIDKLGINPNNKYNTPIGIYSYPAQFVVSRDKWGEEMSHVLPFGGDHPWANIFTVQGNIINLIKMSEDEEQQLYRKIIEVYSRYVPDDAGAEVARIIDSSKASAGVKLPGGRFWFVTMEVAAALQSKLGGRHTARWNTLFREIGVDGAVDCNGVTGKGIIHPNEKSQAVFFSKAAIVNNVRVANKHSPTSIERMQRTGQDNRTMKAQYAAMSEEQLIAKVKSDPTAIMYMPAASETVQMAAVTAMPYAIKYINNPTEKVKQIAANQ